MSGQYQPYAWFSLVGNFFAGFRRELVVVGGSVAAFHLQNLPQPKRPSARF
jgi:hypothetical protein